MFRFKNLSVILSILGFSLFVSHLLMPELVFSLFEIPENESAFFNARRTSILYLGVCVLSFLGRNAMHSQLRQSFCVGVSIIMFGLAILGIYEYLAGFAGLGIMIAVITEVVIGVGFMKNWLSNKDN